MKRIINIIAWVALLLTAGISCNREDDFTQQGKTKIEFGAGSTRAKVSSLDDITAFGVYAQMSLEPDENYETPNDIVYNHILENEKVYRENSETNEWFYDDTQYWVNNRTFHFFAFWPHTLTSRISGDNYQLDYTTPKTADDDILTGYNSIFVDTELVDYPTVSFDFSRVLTKVRLEIEQDWTKNSGDKFWIKSVKLQNVKNSGTLITSRFDKKGTWQYGEDKFSRENSYVDEENPHGLLFEHQKIVAPWGGESVGLHLIPQPIALNDIALTFEYAYQQNGQNADTAEIETTTVKTSLPAGEWLPGMTYTYKVKLYKDNLIVFSNISIQPWGEPITGGTIIIK